MRRRRFVSAGLAALVSPALLPRPVLGTFGVMRNAGTADDPIRLSSNENPLGVPDSARTALLDALPDGNRYPQLDAQLIAAIARKHGVPESTVVLGAGSTDVLRMTVQSLAAGGGRVVVADPTFEHIERYATPFGAPVERVPLAQDGAHDLGRMRAAAGRTRGPVLVFLCNPNNPTGTLTSCDAIAEWIEEAAEDVLFLVDEAYFDFVAAPGYRTFIPDALARPNVLVNRTFSKIYALAGLRVGYGLAHPETIGRVAQFAGDSNVNQLALAAALGCIGDEAFIARSLRTNAESRHLLESTLDELGIERMPAHTNFLMHRIRGSLDRYNARMLEAGVRVGRAFPPMLQWSRVSFGTVAEMEFFAGRLHDFRRQGWI